MEVVHINQKQLAARWPLSEASLERWRTRVRQLITQVYDFIECEFKTCPYKRLNC
jgi:hypothetical protein